jgi:hypothetical protein
VSKLDTNGNFVWASVSSGTGVAAGSSLAIDGNHNVYVSGIYNGSVNFNLGGAATNNLTAGSKNEVFVLKLNSAGTTTWASGLGAGSPADETVGGIGIDGAGNVYTNGTFQGTANFDPHGTHNLTSAGGDDIFVSKLDGAGNFVWADRMGGPAADDPNGIAVSNAGNVYSAGTFQGTSNFNPHGTFNMTSTGGANDIFVSKLDPAGNFAWAVHIGSGVNDTGNGVALDGLENVYVVGNFQGSADFDPGAGVTTLTSAGSSDAYALELTSAGAFVMAKRAGGAGFDSATAVGVNSAGSASIAGRTFPPGTFGSIAVTNTATQEFFVTRLATAAPQTVYGDFDGDGTTDPAVFEPSTSTFYISRSHLGNEALQFGIGTLFGGHPVNVSADYDGDGIVDPAVYEPSTSTFYIHTAAGNEAIQFGIGTLFGGHPIPVPGDYEGDGKIDPAVFEPSTAIFYIARHNAPNEALQFGIGTLFGGHPVPVPATYEGDGVTDPAVYEPSTSTFYILRHSSPNTAIQFGIGTLFGGHPVVVSADYEGDGRIDPAVFEPSTATFYIARHSLPNTAIQFGIGTLFGGHPVVVSANYEGDGKIDPAVFEPTTATFYIARHSLPNTAIQFGIGTLFGGNPIVSSADFQGDGKIDPAVFEPSTSTFYIAKHSAPNQAVQFGIGTLFGGHPVPISSPLSVNSTGGTSGTGHGVVVNDSTIISDGSSSKFAINTVTSATSQARNLSLLQSSAARRPVGLATPRVTAFRAHARRTRAQSVSPKG